MNDPERLVGRVRNRIRLVRFIDLLQRDVALAAVFTLVFAVGARLFGYQVRPGLLVLVALGAAVGAALVSLLLRPVARRTAASEADRILGTSERISTTWAVKSGHADDPLGFLPALSQDAAQAARGAAPGLIRSQLRVRPRRVLLVAAVCLLALLLVPLLPGPTVAADEEETAAEKKAKEKNVEALRRLARTAKTKEAEAKKANQKKLEEITRQVRKEANRLAGKRPDAAKALARLNKLEREVKKEAKRFAGVKVGETDELSSAENKLLDDLAKAIAKLEGADPAETRRMLNRLFDKIESGDMNSIDPNELNATIQSLRGLQRAMEELSRMSANADAEKLKQLLAGLPDSEKLGQIAEALEKLRKAMEEAGIDPSQMMMSEEDLKRLQEQLEDYRNLQITEEDLQRMLEALEELRKIIELGGDISMCQGGLGGLIPIPGLGGAGLGLPLPGLGGDGSGPGTGGRGQGRGGISPMGDDEKPLAPEKNRGRISDQGSATLIRTIRRVPRKDEDPQAYEEIQSQATREAEEALKSGEIPRRRREYIRRYFSDPGTSDPGKRGE